MTEEIHIQENLKRLIEQRYQKDCVGDSVGASILIAKGREVLLEYQVGLSDLENDIKIHADSVFKVASITKEFTSAAILQLIQDNRFSLDDPVCELLQCCKHWSNLITVESLLNHTSGLPEHSNSEAFWLERATELTPKQLLKLFVSEDLLYEPGTQHHYCNSNYITLGLLIEEYSELPYAEYLESHIFQMLGLSKTKYVDEYKVTAGRVRGYAQHSNIVNAPFMHMSRPYAAGALESTCQDQLNWLCSFSEGKVVEQTLVEQAWNQGKINNGDSFNYGLGWSVRHIRDTKFVGHGGCIPGFTSVNMHCPDEQINVIILQNSDWNQPEPFAYQLAFTAMGNPITVPETIHLSSQERNEYQGDFRISENMAIQVSLTDNGLMTQIEGYPEETWRPCGDDTFIFEDGINQCRFKRDHLGQISHIQFYNFIDTGQEFPKIRST